MGVLFSWIVGIAFFGISTLQAASWTVSPNSDDNCEDFDCHLQSVLNIAASNFQDDSISVAAGEYDASAGAFRYEPGESENFALSIQGAGMDQTIIDAKGANQAFWAMTSILPDDSNSDLSFSGMSFRNGLTSVPGGGLRIETIAADIEVESCSFQGNSTSTIEGLGGGGLFALAGDSGSITFTENRFTDNFSSPSAGGGSVAISSGTGAIVMTGNTYLNNDAGDSQGSTGALGGGAVAFVTNGELTLDRNVLLDNFAEAGGGGMFIGVGFSSAKVTNNVVARNQSLGVNDSQGFLGGGAGLRFFLPGGSVDFTNNTVTANSDQAGSGGGVLALMLFNEASLAVSNSIVWGNSAGGGSFCTSSCDDIAIADQLDVDADSNGGTFAIAHSDYSDIFLGCQGPGCTSHATIGSGNLNVDPLFVNAGQSNFHLQSTSDVIDKGDAGAPSIPSTDFDGQARVNGSAPDMGAFEFSNAAIPENCANGLDDDGDEAADCADSDCAGEEVCQEPEPAGEICDNATDDDGDKLIDCLDLDCIGDEACSIDFPDIFEICNNEVDDDENGQTDCDDAKCLLAPECIDIDLPGGDCSALTDCLNPDCHDAEVCQDILPESPELPELPELPEIDLPSACAMTGTGGFNPLGAVLLLAPLALVAGRRKKPSRTVVK
ncbi:MAG TPA: choice-of-anchor Q domain-containing protein [bacterium]|nr:choice-of-anchor Q domain-containing protein [bacterium]